MDTVFGTLINDELKLVNHRMLRSGVQHRHDIRPLDPQPYDPVEVHLLTPGQAGFDQITLIHTTDGSPPAGSRGEPVNGTVIPLERVHIEWDSLIWDYVVHWQAVIPGQPDQTMVQYIISAWSNDGDETFADWPDIDDAVQHATMLHFKSIPEDTALPESGPFPGQGVFNYHVDIIHPPHWASEAIIYQVLVDRFYPGDDQAWRQTTDVYQHCGGTLWGVRDKLDYIAELGVNCLWLSPTWVSPSPHGYDVTDYDHVEPRLGGDEALRAVVKEAHQRGIRVLLDMACNHLSNEHPIFIEAQKDEHSPYRDWFFFDERIEHGYKTFFHVPSMPRLNLAFPAARDWMASNAVRWLRDFDVDGYRLDVADGLGPGFWPYFRQACKAAKPDCLIFGEIIDTPHRLRTYTGRLDGCLDFPLNDALRRTFVWETLTKPQLQAFVDNNAAYYTDDFVAPSFLDNHDMNRFSFIAGNNAEKLKRAVSFQMQLPNPPIIYYGTEVGVRQADDLMDRGFGVSRIPMIWGDEQDTDLLSFFKQEIQARKERFAGRNGDL
ncbi:MAG: alpha-amylase family glycosyl hydrolase [Chloroflexota bacterium]